MREFTQNDIGPENPIDSAQPPGGPCQSNLMIQAAQFFDNGEPKSWEKVNLFADDKSPPVEVGGPTKQPTGKKSPTRADKRGVSMPPSMLKSILRKPTLAMDSDYCSKGQDYDLGNVETIGEKRWSPMRDEFMSPYP